MNLTPMQRAAVGSTGNLLLRACPGSGKTRTIIARLVKDVEELRESTFSVACITYTNAAVLELEQRVLTYLGPDDNRHYVICTIHAFCLNEILRPFVSRVAGFHGSMEVLTKDRPEFQEIANYAAERVNWFGLSFWDYEGFAGLSLDSEGNLTGLALENDMLRRAAPHFWSRCHERGFIDFANIIYKSYCLLRDDPEIAHSVANKFKEFLVDEFQDTTELQIEILKRLYAQNRTRFFLVGDPAQSIFGFTGARPELLGPFAQHIGARTDISLFNNFRSNPQIVEHANRLIPREPPMTSDGEMRRCQQEPVYRHVQSTITAITDEFLPLIADLGIPLGRAAVLARNWSPLFPIARKLREYGVPVVGPGARPYRRSRLFASLAEQLCGAVAEQETYNIRQLERAVFHAVQDVTGRRHNGIFSYEGRVVIIRMLRHAAALAQVHGASNWLDEMSEIVGELLYSSGWIDRSQTGLFRTSVEEMKADMRASQVDIPNLGIDDLGMFASPHRALRLMTIHNAKGHEYAAVALIDLREGTLPDFRAGNADAIAGERRLLYVGITRAERLLMYVSNQDNWHNPPSRFLGPNGVNVI